MLLSIIGFAIMLGTVYDVTLHQPAVKKAKPMAVDVVGKICSSNGQTGRNGI